VTTAHHHKYWQLHITITVRDIYNISCHLQVGQSPDRCSIKQRTYLRPNKRKLRLIRNATQRIASTFWQKFRRIYRWLATDSTSLCFIKSYISSENSVLTHSVCEPAKPDTVPCIVGKNTRCMFPETRHNGRKKLTKRLPTMRTCWQPIRTFVSVTFTCQLQIYTMCVCVVNMGVNLYYLTNDMCTRLDHKGYLCMCSQKFRTITQWRSTN